MIQKRFTIIILINFVILVLNAYNNISINLCDKINQKFKFSLLYSLFLIKKNYLDFKSYYKGIKQLKIKLKKLEDENKLLKAQLLLKNKKKLESNIHLISAEVIANSFSNEEDAIFINAGLTSGVIEGAGVISDKGIVGVVVRSFTNYSKVLLLTDIRFSVDVIVKNKNAKGLLYGNGDGFCIIKYLPVNIKYQIGDLVVTGGFDGIFPTNIPIGKIIKIEKNNLYKSAIVKTNINKDTLNKVFILR